MQYNRTQENSPVEAEKAWENLYKKQRGRIEIIMGPMFAGKSTELLRRVKRHSIAGRKCLIIKYIGDDRYSDECISTHDKQQQLARSCKLLSDIGDDFLAYDVIGIDEGQFFKDLVEFSEYAANKGKTIMLSALDGTYQRKGFDNITQLIPMAEEIQKLAAICKNCGADASFTFRTVLNDQLELIGGDQIYKPVCRECFITEQSKQVYDSNSSAISSFKFDNSNEYTKSNGSSPNSENEVQEEY